MPHGISGETMTLQTARVGKNTRAQVVTIPLEYMTVHFEGLVAGFSRYHKVTLGTELRQGSRAVLQQVLRANNHKEKSERRVKLPAIRDRNEPLLPAFAARALKRWPQHRKKNARAWWSRP